MKQYQFFNRLSFRITLLLVIILAAPSTATLLWLGNQLKNDFRMAALNKISEEVELRTDRVQTLLDYVKKDLESQAFEIEDDIFQFTGNNQDYFKKGIPDQFFQSKLHKEISSDLGNDIKKHQDFFQLRIILKNGQELVRFNKTKERINQVPKHELQDKKDRPYFKHFIDDPINEVHIDSASANQEFGKTVIPEILAIRLGKRLYLPDGSLFGVLVLNIRSDMFFKHRDTTKVTNRSIIFNSAGRYLIHWDDTQSHLAEPSGNENILIQEPELKENLQKFESRIHFDSQTNEFRVWRKIRFDKGLKKDDYWVIMVRIDESSITAPWFSTVKGGLIWLAAILIVGFMLSVFLIHMALEPVRLLRSTIRKIGVGDLSARVNIISKTELGEIATTFDEMATTLQKQDIELRKKQEKLEVMVDARTSELKQTNELLIQEIDVRKTAEYTLKAYERIVSTTPDHISLIDRNYCYQIVNHSFSQAFNMKKELLVGQSVASLYGENMFNALIKFYLDQCLAGEIVRYDSWFNFEATGPRYMSMSYYPYFSEEDNITGVVVSSRDITELKNATEAVTDMAQFAELNPAPVLRADRNGRILIANPAASKIFDNMKLTQTTWDALVPNTRFEFFNKEVEKETYQEEFKIKDNDYFFTYRKVANSNNIQIYGAEITERRKLAERLRQVQKMEAIGQLAGGIAHDFNTLIGIILGYCEVLQEDLPIESSAANFVSEIQSAGMRSKALVQQVMDFSKPSKEGWRPVKLANLVHESLRLIRSSLPKNIQIDFQNHTMSQTIQANPNQINQIIMNLVMNARDSYPGETGKIHIILDEATIEHEKALSYQIKAGRYSRLTISDQGHGISPNALEHIFEPFFTGKEVGKGTGLGLSVVHGITKSHQGFITVNSLVNQGSTFIVHLPIVEV
jgi:PAS domain S-box-containing protein